MNNDNKPTPVTTPPTQSPVKPRSGTDAAADRDRAGHENDPKTGGRESKGRNETDQNNSRGQGQNHDQKIQGQKQGQGQSTDPRRSNDSRDSTPRGAEGTRNTDRGPDDHRVSGSQSGNAPQRTGAGAGNIEDSDDDEIEIDVDPMTKIDRANSSDKGNTEADKGRSDGKNSAGNRDRNASNSPTPSTPDRDGAAHSGSSPQTGQKPGNNKDGRSR